MTGANEGSDDSARNDALALLCEQRHGYPRASPMTWQNVVVHVAGASLLLALLARALEWSFRAVGCVHPAVAALALLAGTLMGLFVADLLSGAAHWAFDTWFAEDHPIFHRMVLVVREHHIAPQAMFGYPFYNDTGQLSVLALLVAAPVVVPITQWAGPSVFTIAAMWASVVQSLCFVFMLEFHKCGHRKSAGGLLGLMQRCRLLLSPAHHWRHHSGAYDTHYCLINGWADRVMDALGGWRAIERVVHRLTGAAPRASDDQWLEAWLTPRRRALWYAARPDRTPSRP